MIADVLVPPSYRSPHHLQRIIMADNNNSHPPQQQQQPESGAAFFDNFFASALQRANMSSSELKGLTEELSAAAHPVPSSSGSASKDVYAPDGNGLDCGRDPGDVVLDETSQASASAAQQQKPPQQQSQGSRLLRSQTVYRGSPRLS